MTDEMFDRDYQNAREAMNADIDRALIAFIRGLRVGFRVFHQAQWHAPWEGGARRRARRHRAGIA